MATLTTRCGMLILVDDDDLALVSKHVWRAHRSGKSSIHNVYAVHGDRPMIKMHNVIMPPPEGLMIDHINRNGLDNRKSNLRICNHHQNMMNRRVHINNKSGYAGICYDRKWSRWCVTVGNTKIGRFKVLEDAIAARLKAEKEVMGKFSPKYPHPL